VPWAGAAVEESASRPASVASSLQFSARMVTGSASTNKQLIFRSFHGPVQKMLLSVLLLKGALKLITHRGSF
jgi:hypothetical protein